jgi:hypothetical protein
MPSLLNCRRFVAGFIVGAVLAAAATASAQGTFMRFSGGYGLQPRGSGSVSCTNAIFTALRADVTPITSSMPILIWRRASEHRGGSLPIVIS